MQLARCRELEPHPVVVQDGGAGAVARKLSWSGKEEREHMKRFGGSHFRQIRGCVTARPVLFDVVQHGHDRIERRHHQHIVVVHHPRRAVGEDRRERGDDRAQVRLAHGVGMGPLADDAARCQPRTRAFEELPCEERRHARNPGVRRLGNDHVVLTAREKQMRTSVADDEVCARVGERLMILRVEEVRRLDNLG